MWPDVLRHPIHGNQSLNLILCSSARGLLWDGTLLFLCWPSTEDIPCRMCVWRWTKDYSVLLVGGGQLFVYTIKSVYTHPHTHTRLTAFDFQDNLGKPAQKGKPFWILLKQEIMGWQWHQLDHMQIICTTLQTDNHASTPSLNFLWARCFS